MLRKFLIVVLSTIPLMSLAKELRSLTVIMKNQQFHSFGYYVSENYAITEGDIILATIKDIKNSSAVAISYPERRWPEGRIPFEIDHKLSIKNKSTIYYAIMHYIKHTPIRFVERTKKNQDKYPDYVVFTSGQGCSSYVGRIGGAQPITLNAACSYRATIHEIGHALGLWHEQNRVDRDNYVIINYENIIPEYKYNFNQHPGASTDIGEYDFDSIMHYSNDAFSKNGKKTITVISDNRKTGQRNTLSSGDITAIKHLYLVGAWH